MPKTMKINSRKIATLARSGRDRNRDMTIFRNDRICFTLLSGRSTRIVRNADTFAIPGINPSHPITTTRKSSMFHASLR